MKPTGLSLLIIWTPKLVPRFGKPPYCSPAGILRSVLLHAPGLLWVCFRIRVVVVSDGDRMKE